MRAPNSRSCSSALFLIGYNLIHSSRQMLANISTSNGPFSAKLSIPGLSVVRLVCKSPRLGVLVAVALASAFTVLDVVVTILGRSFGAVGGISPWWKLSLVFKCLSDTAILDDFASELKRISGGGLPIHEGDGLQPAYGDGLAVSRHRPWPSPREGKLRPAAQHPFSHEIEDFGDLVS
jgi:hypothetical protein